MRGLNERIDSSWNDETSAITQSSGSATAVSRDQRVADVAADVRGVPASRKIAPMSAVVVVLPLVPVTATIGALQMRYATSISL